MCTTKQWALLDLPPFKLEEYRSMPTSKTVSAPATTLSQCELGRDLVHIGQQLITTTQDSDGLNAVAHAIAELFFRTQALVDELEIAEGIAHGAV